MMDSRMTARSSSRGRNSSRSSSRGSRPSSVSTSVGRGTERTASRSSSRGSRGGSRGSVAGSRGGRGSSTGSRDGSRGSRGRRGALRDRPTVDIQRVLTAEAEIVKIPAKTEEPKVKKKPDPKKLPISKIVKSETEYDSTDSESVSGKKRKNVFEQFMVSDDSQSQSSNEDQNITTKKLKLARKNPTNSGVSSITKPEDVERKQKLMKAKKIMSKLKQASMSKGHSKVPKSVKLKQSKTGGFTQKRKPGRPPGAKNKPKTQPNESKDGNVKGENGTQQALKDLQKGKPKGRPKGSKNRPKSEEIIKDFMKTESATAGTNSDDEKLSEIAAKMEVDLPKSSNMKPGKIKHKKRLSHGVGNESKTGVNSGEATDKNTDISQKVKVKRKKKLKEALTSETTGGKVKIKQKRRKAPTEQEGNEEDTPQSDSLNSTFDSNVGSTSSEQKSRRGKTTSSLQRSMSIETLDVIGLDDQLTEGSDNIPMLAKRGRGRGRSRGRGRGRGRGLRGPRPDRNWEVSGADNMGDMAVNSDDTGPGSRDSSQRSRSRGRRRKLTNRPVMDTKLDNFLKRGKRGSNSTLRHSLIARRISQEPKTERTVKKKAMQVLSTIPKKKRKRVLNTMIGANEGEQSIAVMQDKLPLVSTIQSPSEAMVPETIKRKIWTPERLAMRKKKRRSKFKLNHTKKRKKPVIIPQEYSGYMDMQMDVLHDQVKESKELFISKIFGTRLEIKLVKLENLQEFPKYKKILPQLKIKQTARKSVADFPFTYYPIYPDEDQESYYYESGNEYRYESSDDNSATENVTDKETDIACTDIEQAGDDDLNKATSLIESSEQPEEMDHMISNESKQDSTSVKHPQELDTVTTEADSSTERTGISESKITYATGQNIACNLAPDVHAMDTETISNLDLPCVRKDGRISPANSDTLSIYSTSSTATKSRSTSEGIGTSPRRVITSEADSSTEINNLKLPDKIRPYVADTCFGSVEANNSHPAQQVADSDSPEHSEDLGMPLCPITEEDKIPKQDSKNNDMQDVRSEQETMVANRGENIPSKEEPVLSIPVEDSRGVQLSIKTDSAETISSKYISTDRATEKNVNIAPETKVESNKQLDIVQCQEGTHVSQKDSDLMQLKTTDEYKMYTTEMSTCSDVQGDILTEPIKEVSSEKVTEHYHDHTDVTKILKDLVDEVVSFREDTELNDTDKVFADVVPKENRLSTANELADDVYFMQKDSHSYESGIVVAQDKLEKAEEKVTGGKAWRLEKVDNVASVKKYTSSRFVKEAGPRVKNTSSDEELTSKSDSVKEVQEYSRASGDNRIELTLRDDTGVVQENQTNVAEPEIQTASDLSDDLDVTKAGIGESESLDIDEKIEEKQDKTSTLALELPEDDHSKRESATLFFNQDTDIGEESAKTNKEDEELEENEVEQIEMEASRKESETEQVIPYSVTADETCKEPDGDERVDNIFEQTEDRSVADHAVSVDEQLEEQDHEKMEEEESVGNDSNKVSAVKEQSEEINKLENENMEDQREIKKQLSDNASLQEPVSVEQLTDNASLQEPVSVEQSDHLMSPVEDSSENSLEGMEDGDSPVRSETMQLSGSDEHPKSVEEPLIEDEGKQSKGHRASSPLKMRTRGRQNRFWYTYAKQKRVPRKSKSSVPMEHCKSLEVPIPDILKSLGIDQMVQEGNSASNIEGNVGLQSIEPVEGTSTLQEPLPGTSKSQDLLPGTSTLQEPLPGTSTSQKPLQGTSASQEPLESSESQKKFSATPEKEIPVQTHSIEVNKESTYVHKKTSRKSMYPHGISPKKSVPVTQGEQDVDQNQDQESLEQRNLATKILTDIRKSKKSRKRRGYGAEYICDSWQGETSSGIVVKVVPDQEWYPKARKAHNKGKGIKKKRTARARKSAKTAEYPIMEQLPTTPNVAMEDIEVKDADVKAAQTKTSEVERKSTSPEVETVTKSKKHSSFHCVLCPYYTSVKATVIEHIYGHTPHIPFQCSICSERFGTKSGTMVHHRREHKGQASEIVKHTLIKEEDFYTELGPGEKISPSPQEDVRLAENVSSGSDPGDSRNSQKFSSGMIDEMDFANGSRERKHKPRIPVLHVADPTRSYYQCRHCTFSSNEKSEMMFHISTDHSGDQRFMCPICEVVFSRDQAGMRRHFYTSHPGQDVQLILDPDFYDIRHKDDPNASASRRSYISLLTSMTADSGQKISPPPMQAETNDGVSLHQFMSEAQKQVKSFMSTCVVAKCSPEPASVTIYENVGKADPYTATDDDDDEGRLVVDESGTSDFEPQRPERRANEADGSKDPESDSSGLKIVSVCSIAPEDFQHDSPSTVSTQQSEIVDSDQPMDLTSASNLENMQARSNTSSVCTSSEVQMDTQSVMSETDSISSRASSPSVDSQDTSTNYKVFRCHMCSDTFYQFESFISHLAMIHQDPNISFKCAECPCNIFETYESFEQHSRTVHSFARPDVTRHALVPARYKVNQQKRQEAKRKKEQKKRRLEFITSKLRTNTGSGVSSPVAETPKESTAQKSSQQLPKAAYTVTHHAYESSSPRESKTNITTAQSPFPPRHLLQGGPRRFPAPAHTIRSSNVMPYIGKAYFQGRLPRHSGAQIEAQFTKPLSQPSVAMVHPTVQTKTWHATRPLAPPSVVQGSTASPSPYASSQAEESDIEPGEIGRHGQRYQTIRSQLAGPSMAEGPLLKSSDPPPLLRAQFQQQAALENAALQTTQKLRQVGQVPPLRRAPDSQAGQNRKGTQRKDLSFTRPPQMQQYSQKSPAGVPHYPPPPYPHQRSSSAPPTRPAGQSQISPRQEHMQGMAHASARFIRNEKLATRNPPPNVAPFAHKAAAVRQTPHKCPYCHVQTFSSTYLEQHMKIHPEHTQQDLFECPYCPGSPVMPKNVAVHHVKQEHPNYPPRLKLFRPAKEQAKQTI